VARVRALLLGVSAAGLFAGALCSCQRAPAGAPGGTASAAQPAARGALSPGPAGTPRPTPETAFLDTLAARTFAYFWDLSDPHTGLTPDRWPTQSFASVSATGFALTAYPIGALHGWVTREAACQRVLTTLRFLWTAPQDTSRTRACGYKGFFYHFLDPKTGTRFADVELSTQDTALLLAGVLFCQTFFDAANPAEAEVRALAESLYARADWRWAQVRPPAIGHGWDPEGGPLPYDWRGYNEAMLTYILALGSPSHPVGRDAWDEWVSGYRWGTFQGQELLGFAPLFGHQYTHVWVDFRGIRDAAMQARGLDYFENSRRAVLAQQAYAVANPAGWSGYGNLLWGLTACDGPLDGVVEIAGRRREFHTYWARGASFTEVQDDGTLAPTAAGGSIVFAPEIVLPTLLHMRTTYGAQLFGRYGFVDAFNPTLVQPVPAHHGHVDPARGWFDTDYLGIDQGPILAMVENFRSELVWRTMRRNPHLVRGLRAAGFTGGWLEEAP
jgi:hypothetical protein